MQSERNKNSAPYNNKGIVVVIIVSNEIENNARGTEASAEINAIPAKTLKIVTHLDINTLSFNLFKSIITHIYCP